MTDTLTLWNSTEFPDSQNASDIICNWEGYHEGVNSISLLKYVDLHRDRLRHQYLKWINDFGETVLGNKKVVDLLEIDEGFSYWWMMLFAEKNPWKQPTIMDAIRLLAFEEILIRHKPANLKLVSSNKKLNETVKRMCEGLNIKFEWQNRSGNSIKKIGFRDIYNIFPYPAKAFFYIVQYLVSRWSIRKVKVLDWSGGKDAIFICSYFFHLDHTYLKQEKFHSKYWEGFHDLIRSKGLQANWLHHYFPHSAIPSPDVAMDRINEFNLQREKQGYHSFLDSFLTWPIVLGVLRNYFKLLLRAYGLRRIKDAFSPSDRLFSLWPIMKNDWAKSMYGPLAIENLFFFELFLSAIRQLPHQQKGIYLLENQSWEKPFIYAWRKYGHGKLIGVAHSTVRYWDLRYFFDQGTLRRSEEPNGLPQPDLIALNGKTAIDTYLHMLYPPEKIIECEALRYSSFNNKAKQKVIIKREGKINVLVLGDYLPLGTIRMLQMLEKSVPLISADIRFTLKPHSNFVIKAEDYPLLNMNVIENPLNEIIHNFEIAYTSNMTSASVDAYLAGLKVFIMLDESELNFSPLYGFELPGVEFIENPLHLAHALQREIVPNTGNEPTPFFFLDPTLPKWKKILDE